MIKYTKYTPSIIGLEHAGLLLIIFRTIIIVRQYIITKRYKVNSLLFNDTLYQNVTTVVTHEIGSGSWLLCLVLFLFTGKIINRFTHNSEKSLDISVLSTKRV